MTESSKPFSIVVPTYNAQESLEGLMGSLVDSGLVTACEELIVVNDGSTDQTRDVLKGISDRAPKIAEKLKVITYPSNCGRFVARLKGAKEAKSPHILFIDSRVQFDRDFLERMKGADSKYLNWIPRLEIDPSESTFSLYWKRSHEFIFRRHFKAIEQGSIRLTPENFDSYLKGTTVIWLERSTFLEVCEKFEGQTVLNDDYCLLAEFVKYRPIDILSGLRIFWKPRETWSGFLGRLWTRGPSFVEFHVVMRRGVFFWIVILGVVLLTFEFILFLVNPQLALQGLLGVLAAAGLSVLIFAKSASEAMRLAPLHLAVICVFGSGILWGLVANFMRPEMRQMFLRNSSSKNK